MFMKRCNPCGPWSWMSEWNCDSGSKRSYTKVCWPMTGKVYAKTKKRKKSKRSREDLRSGSNDVVDTAVGAGFSVLAKALGAAGLADVLRGEGPFTVLAPTDEAFDKLPAGALADLLRPENKDALVNVLKNHVVEGRWTAAELVDRGYAVALTNKVVSITVEKGSVRAAGVRVAKSDVPATNGMIHVINRVILPAQD